MAKGTLTYVSMLGMRVENHAVARSPQAMAIAAAENAVSNHPVIFFELIKSGTSLQRRGGRTLASAGPPAFRGGRFGGIRTPS